MKINQESLQRLKEDVGPEVMPIIMEQMQQELRQRIVAIGLALNDLDLVALQAEAHSVKSTARTVGLDAVADAALATEMAARAEDQDQSTQQGRELLHLCEQGCGLIAQL